jgi:preprotein translocase subunit SecG
MIISIVIIIASILLGLFVLAQNPKGGGLAAGFTGAQQIGGVQRTADFLEKGTWALASALIVLCLVSASMQETTTVGSDELDAPIDAPQAPATAPDGAVAPIDSGSAIPE